MTFFENIENHNGLYRPAGMSRKRWWHRPSICHVVV